MTVTYRLSNPGDLDAICRHRVEMFEDMGAPQDQIDAMADPFRQWLEPRLSDGRYFGITAEDEGKDVGHAGGFILDWPPGPRLPITDQRGYIFNVHVAANYRRRGIASELMTRIEQEIRGRGIIYIALHASEAGRPLYQNLGWTPTSELAKIFEATEDSSEAPRK